MVAPVIPALNDHEIERILDAAKAAGASEAGYVLLRLPLEVSPLFRDWLLRHYPDRYRHVMSLVRSMRGGKDYDAEFGKRMKGAGPYAWQIARRFEMAAKRLGLNAQRRRMRDDSQSLRAARRGRMPACACFEAGWTPGTPTPFPRFVPSHFRPEKRFPLRIA